MKLSTLINAIDTIGVFRLPDWVAGPDARSVAKTGPEVGPHADAGAWDREIDSIHYRAQEVRPGGLFVAITGQRADGHHFINQALENGAVALVVQKQPAQIQLSGHQIEASHPHALIVSTPDTRCALADLAACFYNHPSQHMQLIAITGTNGKTTVAYLIESILIKAGFKTGVIGTIDYRYGGNAFPNPMTTPESLDLQKILSEMRRSGVTHVVLEASSHAMDLYRIRGCRFNIAVFTNLSQDHLDFHGDMQAYWSSKKRLFTEYLVAGSRKDEAVAVINCDDPRGEELADILSVKRIRTGSTPACDIQAETSRCELVGTKGRLSTPRGSFDFETPLVGLHNIENILSASGAAAALNIPADTIKSGIESLRVIPGRLESIENSSRRFVYVDYAHTPDALENAVSALKAIAPAKIICVFGCGGDRDNEKRPMMGEIVARLCDLAVVTSDNPRSEAPSAIIDQILPGIELAQGCRYAGDDLKNGFDKKGYTVEPDRRRAIRLAISVSRPNDAVLIAGKGHETYQILADTTIDSDDREEAREALRAISSL